MVHIRNNLLRVLTPSKISSVNSFRSSSKTWHYFIRITSSWNQDRLLKCYHSNNKLQPLSSSWQRILLPQCPKALIPKVLIIRAKDQLLELTNSVAATTVTTKAIRISSKARNCDRRIKMVQGKVALRQDQSTSCLIIARVSSIANQSSKLNLPKPWSKYQNQTALKR